MTTAELQLEAIRRIAATDSEETLREVLKLITPPDTEVPHAPSADEVLGYRPNGEPVTIANAAAGWGAALDDFLAGGKTYSQEEVRAQLTARRKPK